VYVFDLDRTGGTLAFVGVHATGDQETAELTFDPTSGLLYAWHGDGRNDVEVLRLTSEPAGAIRRFACVLTYDFPGSGNQEGFALQWTPGGCSGARGAFVTTDDGGAASLHWHRQFPCGF
jgi:hypothetical protein